MRIVLGMSGGVDSSVAALVLKDQGHEVIGVFMKNWEEEEGGVCTAKEDFECVAKTCSMIGIPYYTVNFEREYYERVFSGFLRDYEAGLTPNPDVLCNSEIKFDAFLEFAMNADADLMATGHYARVEKKNGAARLLRGADANKDQSYFLCGLNNAQLMRACFPIGGLTKAQVREIARRAGLPAADKKGSTGICFIGERKFSQFISRYIEDAPGNMVDIDSGKTMGRHEGLFRYTIGQRKGIGIGGAGTGEPWFVADKDAKTNTLYIAQGSGNPKLLRSGLVAEDFNWIGPHEREFECAAKFRYRQRDAAVSVKDDDGQTVTLTFKNKQRAVAPGQFAVLYDGEYCLGGGKIIHIVN